MFNQADLYYLRFLLHQQSNFLKGIDLESDDPEIEQVKKLLAKIDLMIKPVEYIDLWTSSML